MLRHAVFFPNDVGQNRLGFGIHRSRVNLNLMIWSRPLDSFVRVREESSHRGVDIKMLQLCY